MSREAFEGTYDVQLSSGTPFGLDTQVDVILDGDKTLVRFRPPDSTQSITQEATFDARNQSLRLELERPYEVMFISRFAPPTGAAQIFGEGYQAIYGLVVLENRPELPVRRNAVWSAESLEQPPSVPGPPVANPIQVQDFLGTYRLRTTSGTQFGISTQVRIFEVDGGPRISSTDFFGRVLELTDVQLVAETGSLLALDQIEIGGTPQPAFFQVSIAEDAGQGGRLDKAIYGVTIVGDPEQTGIWGGDDEEGGSTSLPG